MVFPSKKDIKKMSKKGYGETGEKITHFLLFSLPKYVPNDTLIPPNSIPLQSIFSGVGGCILSPGCHTPRYPGINFVKPGCLTL